MRSKDAQKQLARTSLKHLKLDYVHSYIKSDTKILAGCLNNSPGLIHSPGWREAL